jgi:hypothetical protein
MAGLRITKAVSAVVLVVGTVVLVLGCGVVGRYVAHQWHERGRVHRLEADLNARLPLGSSWEQAETWFASHGIQPDDIVELGSRTRIGLGATIENNFTLLEPAEILIYLYFSKEGKLTSKSIERSLISL